MVGTGRGARLSSDRGPASGVRQDFPDVGPLFSQIPVKRSNDFS